MGTLHPAFDGYVVSSLDDELPAPFHNAADFPATLDVCLDRWRTDTRLIHEMQLDFGSRYGHLVQVGDKTPDFGLASPDLGTSHGYD